MHYYRTPTSARLLLLALLLACGPSFRVTQYPTPVSLYTAGLERLLARKWDHAVMAFEKLTLELPARDSLLPLSYYHLARAYAGRNDHLLASQTFSRLAESFPTDTLADDALYYGAREYQKMWRSPLLDPTYGGEAVAAYQTLLGLYPDTEWADSANKQLEILQEWFATKDYENAMFYLRKKAYDSAIIYLRGVIERYPNTAKSKDAYLRLAEAFDAIRYRDDKADICKTLREKYPGDRDVINICGPPVVTAPPPGQTTPPAARRDTL
jgi:outer membrane protein assembly factor BamD